MKFLFFADPHFGGADDAGYRRQPRYVRSHGEEIVAALADEARAQGAAFALCGGDLADSGEPGAIAAAAALMRRLPCPVLLALGNHDLSRRGALADWLALAPELFPDGGADWTVVREGLRIDGLCANWAPEPAFWDPRRSPPPPWLSPGQTARLTAGPDAAARIVMTHAQPCGVPPEQTGLAEELHAPGGDFEALALRFAEETGARAWLGAHNHMTLRRERGGTQFVTATALTEAPFELRLFDWDGSRLSMRTLSLAPRLSFRWETDPGQAFVLGRPEDRTF